jgi:3D (Asp-Asp-Asp) domain-containing protein
LTEKLKYGIKGRRQLISAILFMNKYSQKLAYILLLGSVLVNPHSTLAADATVDPAFNASIMSAQMSESNAVAVNELVPAGPADARYTTSRIVTAYSSTPDQCDSTPFITANGTHVHDGIIAANWLKFGTRVRIPEMFGDKVFIVADRMNPRFDDRADIWMNDRQSAMNFGLRRLTIEVL